MLKDNLFIYFYKDFLVNIKKDAWFDFYLMFDPRTLAFLSLAAFLDGKIDQNDLCTVHLIASAMFEKQQGRIENFYVKDETKKTIVHTLKKAHYPPFEVFQDSEDLPIIFQKYGQINPLIISDKTEEELQCVKDEFIKNFDKKTPLQRTVLSYDFKAQLDDTVAMLEANLYCNAVSAEGFTNIEKDETRNEMKATVVIPQLSMIANLSRQLVKSHTTVAFPEGVMAMDKKTDKLIPKTHELVFGYSENQEVEDAFQSGVRVISIASPLFMLPYVHYAIKGPPGLGMTLHDLYHLYLDINNPHLDIILNLRALLCDQLSMPDFEDSNGWIKMVTDRLLDREYRFVFFMEGERLDQLSFLLAKILQAVFQVARENPDILEINLKRSIWLFEVFLPLIEVPLKGYPMWDREIFIKTLCKDDCPGVVPIDSRSIDQLKRELCDVLSQKPKGV